MLLASWNTDRRFDDLLHVHGGSVSQGADEGVLDDSVVVGRGPCGFEVEVSTFLLRKGPVP